MEIPFVLEFCCTCNQPFQMTAEFRRLRLADKNRFYCPSGHPQSYIGESDADKLKRETERAERLAQQCLKTQSELNKLKRDCKKTRKPISRKAK